jgi:apolipoprotein N-acyltransferase
MKLDNYFSAGYKGNCIALLAGMLLTLSFAPFNLFPLAIISPAILLCTWLKVSRQQAFLRGWLFGLGLFTTGIYWVYISIHTYGHASIPLSLFITLGLINIVALFPAATGYLVNRWFPENTWYKMLLAFPAFWVFLEWCRSWLFTGFPWLSIGYSQIDSPLSGYAPLLSIYGITLAVMVSAGLLVEIVRNIRHNKNTAAYCNVLLFGVIWLVGGGFSMVTWTQPYKKPVRVSLIQGNIPQEVKWSPDNLKPTLDRYQSLTMPHWDSDIIIWPEGAIPVPLQYATTYIDKINDIAKSHNTTFITGIPVKAPKESGYYNAVITVGNGDGVYVKNRLVPFGEYTPFASILHKLLTSLDIPMSDFIPGKSITGPINAGGVKISTFICYEIAFPEQVNTKRRDINLLLTVSNDAWFGHSIAQAQHLQMAKMRALELGRPLLFVSNDGITAIITADGKLQESIPPFTSGVLTGYVQPRAGLTPWQQTQLDPLLAIMIVMLFKAFQLHYQFGKKLKAAIKKKFKKK